MVQQATPVELGRVGATAVQPRQFPRWLPLAVAALIFALAVAARAYPVLSGGGLYGLGNYDDGVHYAASVALVTGHLPYRHFLLLHPPGILVLLSPFAGLGYLLGDPTGMALARVAWWVLGGVNAVLIARILLPLGRAAALLGGFGYAVFFPAVYSEHTPLLEAPETTALLVSLLLLRSTEAHLRLGPTRLAVAGAVLGIGVTVKIWGVVPVLVVVGWLLFTRGGRAAATYLAGAVGLCLVVYLPFFLSAPAAMWRMVVRDQVGRQSTSMQLTSRAIDIPGATLWTKGQLTPLVVATVVVVAACTLLALLDRRSRLFGVLLVGVVGLLVVTPTWFLHYGGLSAAPVVLVVAAAAQRLVTLAGGVRPWLAGLVVALLAVGLAGYASHLVSYRTNRHFPGHQLARALAGTPGCIATDDPGTLIQTNLLRRNLARGCRIEIDLGGANYDLPHPGRNPVPRQRNPYWQAYCLDYYRSAQAVISVRFKRGVTYTRKTVTIYSSWPVLARAGHFVVRIPQR